MKQIIIYVSLLLLFLPVNTFATDSSALEMTAVWPYGPAQCIAVDHERNITFVGAGAGVYLIDTTYPSRPRLYSRVPLGGGLIKEMNLENNLLFVAAGTGGLRIIDTSYPGEPVELGSYATHDSAYAVSVSGGHAYVIEREYGPYGIESGSRLRILDVTNPAQPTEVSFVETPQDVSSVYSYATAGKIVVNGSYAYVADELFAGSFGPGGRLRVIDVSDPARPVEVYSSRDGEFPGVKDMVISGPYCYLLSRGVKTTFNAYLSIVDITDPQSPTLLLNCHDPGYYPVASAISVEGSFAYITAHNKLVVINVDDPEQPFTESSLELPGDIYDVSVVSATAFVAHSQGLSMVDFSDTDLPRKIGFFDDFPGAATGVWVSGPYVYLADGKGLRILDRTDETRLVEVGFYETENYAGWVGISGNCAYMFERVRTDTGNYVAKRTILDVSDPTAPIQVGTLETGGGFYDAYFSGSHLFLPTGSDGLKIIDISDPAQPHEVSTYLPPVDGSYSVRDVFVEGSYAYVMDTNGLAILRVDDPANPVEESYLSGLSGSGTQIVVSGNYAFLEHSIIDVSDPSTPFVVSTTGLGRADQLIGSGSHVYVVDDWGFDIYNVSCPYLPVLEASHVCAGGGRELRQIFVSGSKVYAALGDEGLAVLDFSYGGRFANFSARGFVGVEDQVLIGGFAIKDAPLTVFLRASGPSLGTGDTPLTGVLADPCLTLINSGDGSLVATNDNWQDSEWAGEIDFDLQPGDFLESAILATLDPGNYTAVMKGVGGKTGVGLVEIYVVSGDGHLFNLSARGFSGQGDNAMISGFTLEDQPSTVLIRAIGKDLENYGVSGVLPDPMLQLFNGSTLVEENKDWRDGFDMDAILVEPEPDDPNEAAIYTVLEPGAYTAVARDEDASTGVVLMEIYDLSSN